MLAAQAIRAGDAELILAGGMESMSRAPFLLFGARSGWKIGDHKVEDALIHDGLWCALENWHMGEAAEHIAAKCGVSRAEQDRFAAQSQKRAAAAWERNAFAKEIVPVTVQSASGGRKPPVIVSRDEGVRPDTTAEALAKLKPAFREGGTVTAGNASTLNDGAAALLVGSARAAERLGTKPLAAWSLTRQAAWRRRTFSCAGTGRAQVLEKAKWKMGDVDLIELNEAFAAQMLACGKELDLDESKVNVNGGAIASATPSARRGAGVDDAALCDGGARTETRPGVAVPGRRQRGGDGGGASVMANRPKMPAPSRDMAPQELTDLIREWAAAQGYAASQAPHATEFAKIVVKDPNGGFTWSVIPNAHQGRRIRRDQVRYVVQQINTRWRQGDVTR